MTVQSWWHDAVQVVRAPTVVDIYGNDAPNWATATVVDETLHASVQPETGLDYTTDRDATTNRRVLYAAPDLDLTPIDRVRHAGTDYEVDGAIEPWHSPGGQLDHIRAHLKAVKG